MATVLFRCDRKNEKIFVLNSSKELDYIPIIGDEIETCNNDFTKATFRIKPWLKEKDHISLRNMNYLNFKVISRKYSLQFDEWVLICEPTTDCLLYLLSNIRVK